MSKGPLLLTNIQEGTLSFSVQQTGKPGYQPPEDESYLITLRTVSGTITCRLHDTVSLEDFGNATCIIPKLYEKESIMENLVCVSPVISI